MRNFNIRIEFLMGSGDDGWTKDQRRKPLANPDPDANFFRETTSGVMASGRHRVPDGLCGALDMDLDSFRQGCSASASLPL